MNVWTSLEPTSSTVAPGAAATTFTLRVRNGGDTVEEYQFAVVGPLTRWSQLTPDKLRLYPGDEGTVTITITVPRTPEALAGPTPFGVQVRPREHPELSDVAEGTVTVTAFGELRAEMNPVTVRGRLSASLRFTINNRGNAPFDITLIGKDDEDALTFDAGGESTRVAAGVIGKPVLKVRPRRRRLTGKPERYPFAVTVTPTEEAVATGAQPAQLRGTYVRIALIPKWLLLLLALLLVLCAIAAGLLYLPFSNLQARLFPPQLPPVAVQAGGQIQQPPPPPQRQTQQQPPPQRAGDSGNGNGNGNGNTAVTIRHANSALTVIDGPRGPAVVTGQANSGSERVQTFNLVRLQDSSVAIIPVVATDRVLEQPNPNNNSQLGLTEFNNGQQLSRSQAWFLRPAGNNASGNDAVTIVNSATGACLTDSGSGRPIQAVSCQSQLAQTQVWQLSAP